MLPQIPQCDYVSERWLIAKVIDRLIRQGEKLDPLHVLRVLYQPSYRDLIRLASMYLSRKCGDAFSDAYKAEVIVLEAILTQTTSRIFGLWIPLDSYGFRRGTYRIL